MLMYEKQRFLPIYNAYVVVSGGVVERFVGWRQFFGEKSVRNFSEKIARIRSGIV